VLAPLRVYLVAAGRSHYLRLFLQVGVQSTFASHQACQNRGVRWQTFEMGGAHPKSADPPVGEAVPSLGAHQNWVACRHFDEIDSTQTFVENNHESFDQSKLTVVSADFQTAGRGTRNRSWMATHGNSILMTCFFRFPSSCETSFVNTNAPNVTKVLALATVRSLQSTVAEAAVGVSSGSHADVKFGIKWPNDVIAGGGKIAGILARAVPSPQEGGRLDGIILGVGINVNTPSSDLMQIDRPVWPATSLRVATGDSQNYDVAVLRHRVITSFAENLLIFFTGGFAALREEVNSLEIMLGMHVHFRIHEGNEVEGRFMGVDDDGLLVLELPDCKQQSFPSGEIVPPVAG